MSPTTRILHCSDLHLVHTGEAADYGFSVLEEILDLARDESVSMILVSGDLFDSRRDFEALLPKVDSLLGEKLDKVPMLLLPGNHEELLRGAGPLKPLSSTRHVEIARDLPYGHRVFDGFDLITVPFQSDYGGFEEWPVPPKGDGPRIVAGHGSVLGVSIPEGFVEERDSVLDSELFSEFEADYVALGHIHQGRELKRDGIPVVYPGSARVWRQGEVGPRGVYLVDIGEGISYSRRILRSAGEYREIRLLLDDQVSRNVSELSRSWGPQDWIQLSFFGLVTSEEAAESQAAGHAGSLSGLVRRVTVDRSNLLIVPEAKDSPLVARFLSEWERLGEEYRGTDLEAAWEESRLVGLEKIARALG